MTDALGIPLSSGDPSIDAGERPATFLAGISADWNIATPEERNELARQLHKRVVITEKTAVAEFATAGNTSRS